MQIFKCLADCAQRLKGKITLLPETQFNASNQANIKKKQKSQNLIEFIFVFPILICMTMVMFEVALFWQDVNAIYNLNAEINANLALVSNANLNLGDRCPAATAAIQLLQTKDSMISLNNPVYNDSAAINDPDLIQDGQEPFALYTYKANTITVGAQTRPQIELWVDCRNPFEDGITTQIEFYHKTMIVKATIPRFDDGPPIVIIPENIFIASPKLNTIKQY